MELKQYFSVLVRRKWIILLTTGLAIAVALVGTLLMRPQYTATTTMRVTPAGGSLDTVQFGDIAYSDRLLNTYNQIATSKEVLTGVAAKLGLAKPPQISVDIPANTELLTISAQDTSPQLAAKEANAVADVLLAQAKDPNLGGDQTATSILNQQLAQAQVDAAQAQQNYNQISQTSKDANQIAAARQNLNLKQDLYNQLLNQYASARLSAAVRANAVSVIQPATVPTEPSAPRPALNLLLGLLVGLVGGTGLAFLFENMDTTLNTTDRIKRVVQGSVLGEIPMAKDQKKSALFNGNSAEEESFRRLRINLLSLQAANPLRALVITSAQMGEGKSTVTANLGRALAQTNPNVLLVDADLRMPSLHKLFNLSNDVGLSSILTQKASPEEAIQRTAISGLCVLTSGPLPPDPTLILGSAQMTDLIKQLEQQYQLVLIDTPAMLAVSDAAVLARAVDGVMLVVARTRSREESVQSAWQQLTHVRANPVGVVVNQAETNGSYYSSYSQRSNHNGQ